MAATSSTDVSQVHSMKVGEVATVNVDGHPERTDSPEFLHAKAAAHKIITTLPDLFQGPGDYQMHHGGSLWLHDGKGWLLVLNEAGIEWSSQFCADPAKIEVLRQNAERIYAGFPESEKQLSALGYPGTGLLHTPITDATGVAKWTDSIFNSCVPLNQHFHIGFAKSGTIGEHNDPKPITDIQHFKVDSFQLLVMDPATGAHAAVVPVGPPGSGQSEVQVVHTSEKHPLAGELAKAQTADRRLILPADHPIAKAAFVNQT
ncbi:MAG TPA: DUF6424 family protein [Actinomycetota bacterium]|nr:DUF6424 family protein [Actinomycetota bacterium]